MASVLETVATAVVVAGLSCLVMMESAMLEATWCVARSDASDQTLQTALDYACGAGADCAPIQSSGLCYLPNTFQAHASYAFNSFYQRKANAPGSCDFAGSATIAKTDPSYGSCVFPPSPSTAGGTAGTGTTTITSSNAPPPPGATTPLYSGGLTPGSTSGVGPVGANTNNCKACMELSITRNLIYICCFLALSSMYQPI